MNVKKQPTPLEVWLVEDNEIYRESITELLDRASGINCPLSVRSCEELLTALEHGSPPDMVLMDIGLPTMDGIEGTRRIRACAPSIRVIMLTVHEERDNIFQAIAAGASGYLLKSARGEEILEAIRAVESGAAPINGYIARKMLRMFSSLAKSSTPRQDYQLTPRERDQPCGPGRRYLREFRSCSYPFSFRIKGIGL